MTYILLNYRQRPLMSYEDLKPWTLELNTEKLCMFV